MASISQSTRAESEVVDLLSDNEDNISPPPMRRPAMKRPRPNDDSDHHSSTRNANNKRRRGTPIDLDASDAEEASGSQPTHRAAQRYMEEYFEPSKKKRRISGSHQHSKPQAHSKGPHGDMFESIDLVEDDAEEKLLQKQRADQIKAQQEDRNKVQKFGTITCTICLDTPTDLTATSCGHVFCHTCLMEALISGEQRAAQNGNTTNSKSQCPVCRKNLSRKNVKDIIPLCLMKRKKPKK
ncbi:hypothetical protein K402DRAFT_393510 [Aulographum hederae CBS 113979]|uniref:RING-type domain-containing protein n=1 Tax=Aulographum hederae CBS 113979 TaxID=1176131 RepID=A0A6G1H1G0_9PEZI|nr:hypothetical protein K402DRAFT_393510 [Aulographum hederae CBS 113979]